jgi:hypothetical protein
MKKEQEEKEVAKTSAELKAEMKNEKIKSIKGKESDVFKALRVDNYKGLVSNCYSELDVNTDMVIQNISYGFIAEGKGGTGKTFRILNKCISDLGEDQVAYADSFTTPTALYVWLYENRDKKILILDDCAGLMDNGKILSMLKGALWHVNDGKTRIVNYLTTKPPKDEYDEPLPRSFEVDARIIIITNYVNDDNPHVKAILSRVNKVVVEVPRKELLIILRQIIQKDYHSLSQSDKEEILNYLESKTSNASEDLNIRTLLRMLDYKIWANKNSKGEAWQPLCLKLLQRDDRLALVEKILDDPTLKTEIEREDKFIELTGDSRATYYRLKKKLRSASSVVLSALDKAVKTGA